jgi:asparagine synthase (glutamine-hydrolysing)
MSVPYPHAPCFSLMRLPDGSWKPSGEAAFAWSTMHGAAAPSAAAPGAGWRWDGTELEAWTDRHGFAHLFYLSRPGLLAVSPSLAQLARSHGAGPLDDAALAVVLRAGFLVGTDTVLRDVRILPPGGRLRTRGEGLSVTGGYGAVVPHSLSREAALDGYVTLFDEALRRCEPVGRIVVPLSGGRDSRHILLGLVASGRKPDLAMTTSHAPFADGEDLSVAVELADRAGVAHAIVGPSADLRREERFKNVITHFSTLQHGWIVRVAEAAAAAGGTVYEGVAGDTLSTGFFNTPSRQRMWDTGDFDALAEEFLGIAGEGYLPNALHPDLYARVSRDAAHARLLIEIRLHADAPNPMGSFLFWNRTRRVTGLAPTALFGARSAVWCPYLDESLVTFLRGLPAEYLVTESYEHYHRFHTEAIARAYPAFASVPYAAKGGRPTSATAAEVRLAGAMLRELPARPGRRVMRPGFLPARLLRVLLDPRYRSSALSLHRITAYLYELDSLLAG